MRVSCIGTLFIVAALACPVWAGSTVIFKCVDGDPASLQIAGNKLPQIGTLACDGDGMPDGACSFLSGCPGCSVRTPPCAAPCFNQPHYVFATVPVARRQTIRIGNQTLIFRCNATATRHHR